MQWLFPFSRDKVKFSFTLHLQTAKGIPPGHSAVRVRLKAKGLKHESFEGPVGQCTRLDKTRFFEGSAGQAVGHTRSVQRSQSSVTSAAGPSGHTLDSLRGPQHAVQPLEALWQHPDDHITFACTLTPNGRGGWKDKEVAFELLMQRNTLIGSWHTHGEAVLVNVAAHAPAPHSTEPNIGFQGYSGRRPSATQPDSGSQDDSSRRPSVTQLSPTAQMHAHSVGAEPHPAASKTSAAGLPDAHSPQPGASATSEGGLSGLRGGAQASLIRKTSSFSATSSVAAGARALPSAAGAAASDAAPPLQTPAPKLCTTPNTSTPIKLQWRTGDAQGRGFNMVEVKAVLTCTRVSSAPPHPRPTSPSLPAAAAPAITPSSPMLQQEELQVVLLPSSSSPTPCVQNAHSNNQPGHTHTLSQLVGETQLASVVPAHGGASSVDAWDAQSLASVSTSGGIEEEASWGSIQSQRNSTSGTELPTHILSPFSAQAYAIAPSPHSTQPISVQPSLRTRTPNTAQLSHSTQLHAPQLPLSTPPAAPLLQRVQEREHAQETSQQPEPLVPAPKPAAPDAQQPVCASSSGAPSPSRSEAGLSSCRSMPPLELASSVSSSTVSTASATPQVTAAAGNHTASSTPTRPTACVLASLQNSRGRTSPGAAPTTTAGAALAPAAARQAAVPAPPAAAATDIAATSSSAATNAAMPGLQQQQQQQQQRVKPSGGLMSSLDLRIRQAAAAILSHTIQQPPQQQQQLEEEQAEDRRQQWQQQQPVNEEVQTGTMLLPVLGPDAWEDDSAGSASMGLVLPILPSPDAQARSSSSSSSSLPPAQRTSDVNVICTAQPPRAAALTSSSELEAQGSAMDGEGGVGSFECMVGSRSSCSRNTKRLSAEEAAGPVLPEMPRGVGVRWMGSLDGRRSVGARGWGPGGVADAASVPAAGVVHVGIMAGGVEGGDGKGAGGAAVSSEQEGVGSEEPRGSVESVGTLDSKKWGSQGTIAKGLDTTSSGPRIYRHGRDVPTGVAEGGGVARSASSDLRGPPDQGGAAKGGKVAVAGGGKNRKDATAGGGEGVSRESAQACDTQQAEQQQQQQQQQQHVVTSRSIVQKLAGTLRQAAAESTRHYFYTSEASSQGSQAPLLLRMGICSIAASLAAVDTLAHAVRQG